MAIVPPFMRLPTELRVQIIKELNPSSTKFQHLPCCGEHHYERYYEEEVASNIDKLALVSAGVRDVVALMRVSQTLYQEVASTFFGSAVAEFCLHDS